jgi:hypothetical protein
MEIGGDGCNVAGWEGSDRGVLGRGEASEGAAQRDCWREWGLIGRLVGS